MIPHIGEWVFLLRLFLEPRNQLTLQKPEAKHCSADLKGGLSLCSIASLPSHNLGTKDWRTSPWVTLMFLPALLRGLGGPTEAPPAPTHQAPCCLGALVDRRMP